MLNYRGRGIAGQRISIFSMQGSCTKFKQRKIIEEITIKILCCVTNSQLKNTGKRDKITDSRWIWGFYSFGFKGLCILIQVVVLTTDTLDPLATRFLSFSDCEGIILVNAYLNWLTGCTPLFL